MMKRPRIANINVLFLFADFSFLGMTKEFLFNLAQKKSCENEFSLLFDLTLSACALCCVSKIFHIFSDDVLVAFSRYFKVGLYIDYQKNSVVP